VADDRFETLAISQADSACDRSSQTRFAGRLAYLVTM
jgi:hypothetical protein